MPAQPGGAADIIGRDRFGIDAAEIRIMRTVQGGDAAVRAAEQLIETTSADAKKRLMGEPQFRPGNQFEIDQLLDGVKMGWPKILQGDFTRPAVDGWNRALVEAILDLLTKGLFRRTSIMGLYFIAVENRRIMAGGNHH